MRLLGPARNYVCLVAVAIATFACQIRPAHAATQRSAAGDEFGSGPYLQSANPVAVSNAGFTVISSFGCAGGAAACGLAGTRYAYFLTIRINQDWQPVAPLTFTIHATFDPSLSHNNALAFGLIDSATDPATNTPGTDVRDCASQPALAARTSCLDGFLAAAEQTADALSFTLQPSYTFNGTIVTLRPGDQIILYATSYFPPACSLTPPQPRSSSDWSCVPSPSLEVAGPASRLSQNVFAPSTPPTARRTQTVSTFFTASAASAASAAPPVALFDPQGNTLLDVTSTVRCFGDPALSATNAPCGQSFQPALLGAAALQPSQYVYFYTLTFAEAWTSPFVLSIQAPFDPAMSREFGQLTYGVLQDAMLAANPDTLLGAASGPVNSSPLQFSIQPPPGGFQPDDTVILFATSFYPPPGCDFTGGAIRNCSAGAPISLSSLAGTLASSMVLGPSLSLPPRPSITSLASTTSAGPGAALNLDVNGTIPAGTSSLDQLNFVAGAQVLLNGIPLPSPSLWSATSALSTLVPISNLASSVPAQIAVRNPPLNPDDPGQVSEPVSLPNDANPLPFLDSVMPSSVLAGSEAFTATFTGTNFVAGCSVQINSTTIAASCTSSTSATATIPVEAVAQPGTLLLSVVNPMPGGGTSNAIQFQVAPASPPSLSSISPTGVIASTPGFVLLVTGTGFATSAAVQVNGTAVATTFNSASSLTAMIPMNLIAAAGTASITVLSPSPGGATSNSLPLQVNNPVPAISSLSTTTALINSPPVAVTINGTGFATSAMVQVNGAASTLLPTNVTPTSLTVVLPAALLTSAQTLSLTVVDPPPGGGTSNAVIFTVANPVPMLSSLSPSSVLAGSAGFNLVLTGTNFVSNSSVELNGTPLTGTLAANGTLTAAIPANLLASAGTISIVVMNPTPGGGSSSAVTFAVTDFSLSSATGAQTVNAGQSGMFTVNLATQVGALPSAVSLACSGVPTNAFCSFNPSSFSIGTASGSATLTISTTARAVAAPREPLPPLPAALLMTAALLLLASARLKLRTLSQGAMLAAALLALVFVAACGSGDASMSSSPPPVQGTPAGTYMITVSASSGTTAHTTTVTLQVN